MNWKYVMAAACVIGALLAGGWGKPSVHVMTGNGESSFCDGNKGGA